MDGTDPLAAAVEAARTEPGEAPLDTLEAGLRADDVRTRDRAATGIYEVSKDHGDRLLDSVPLIVRLLREERVTLRTKAVKILDNVGRVDATALLPHTARLVELLGDESTLVSSEVAAPLLRIAEAEPSTLVPYIEDIDGLLLADIGSTRLVGIAIIERIAATEPQAVLGTISSVLDVLEDGSDPDSGIPMDPTTPRGRAKPDDLFRGMQNLVAGRERSTQRATLRHGALAILLRLVEADPRGSIAELEMDLPRLYSLLDDPSPAVRGGAAGVLAGIADVEPAAVKPVEQRLIELLEGPTMVGANAVRALESLGTDDARDALEATVAEESVDPAVRGLAKRALAEFGE